MEIIVLWVDLADGDSDDLIKRLRRIIEVRKVTTLAEIRDAIEVARTPILCFDFAAAAAEELAALHECKLKFPSVPIVMLTEQHSEMLAVWALRTRVWNYLVKPVIFDDLLASIEAISTCIQENGHGYAHGQMLPDGGRVVRTLEQKRHGNDRIVAKAQRYVEAHLSEKISATEVARLCGVSPFHFSRLFKRAMGTTFIEYVVLTRIYRAKQLLRDARASITAVSYEVGFSDVSYFGKVFRRCEGISPSEYQVLAQTDAPTISRTSNAEAEASGQFLHTDTNHINC